MLTLILGGARSGKSRLAARLASGARRVTYIATASGGSDQEMMTRIAHHRLHRPAEWRTIEEPLLLGEAVRDAAAEADAIVVDCLTLWLSNLFWEHRDSPEQIDSVVNANVREVHETARRLEVILVSNELGSGTVPEAAVTRAFRDAQGLLNQSAAELAEEVILTVAGLPVYLKSAKERKS
jgi:adenosylcobinamide kinase/adenosylcobinamide-phosphate guanylyltransferase